MRFLGLLPILALFAFSQAFVPGRTPSLLGVNKPELLNNVFPGFERPSEEEWIEIIKGTIEGKSPVHLMNSDTVLSLNETGCFENTKGGKGSWNLTSRVDFQPDQEGGGHLRIASGESIMYNGIHLGRGTFTFTAFTDITRYKAIGIARAFYRAIFLIREDKSFDLVGTDEGLVAGSIEALDDTTVIVGGVSTALQNITNDYSITAISEEAILAFANGRNNITGVVGGNSMPLGHPKSQSAMDEILKLVELTSDPAGGGANYTGYFTIGDTGSFHLDADYTAVNLKTGDIFNTTSVANGNYASVGSPSEEQLSAYQYGLVEIMTRSLF